MRKIIYLASILLLISISQISLANCSKHHIRDLLSADNLKKLKLVDKQSLVTFTTTSGSIEICTYKAKRARGHAFAYVLVYKDRVVDCGETTQPPIKRAQQKSNPNRNDYKLFDQMIAFGPFENKAAAQRKELECVCKKNPKLTKRPVCKTR